MATCIALRDLSVDCIVGIREREQRNLQPLVLDVRMEIAAPSLEAAASTGALDQSLNYSAVAKQLAFVCQHGQWGLLESLSTAICRLLLLRWALLRFEELTTSWRAENPWWGEARALPR